MLHAQRKGRIGLYDVSYGNRLEILSRLVKETGPTLDIGGGSGGVLEFLGDKRTPYYILDASPEEARKAAAKGGQAILHDLNTGSLPFRDKAFETVIASEIFEHLLRPRRVLSEIKRVLRATGSLIVSLPNEATLWQRFSFLVKGRIDLHPFEEHDIAHKHLHFPNIDDNLKLIDSEFRVEKVVFHVDSSLGRPAELVPNALHVCLAKVLPSLFARNVILIGRKR
jgi:methionine biosynthesis protein MetW